MLFTLDPAAQSKVHDARGDIDMTRFFMMKFTSRKFTSRAGLNLAGADPALPHQYSSNIALGDVTVYLGMTK